MLRPLTLVVLFFIACSEETSKQPVQIDLTNWRLTLPVDDNGDGKPDSYWPEEMNEALVTGALRPYFYKAEDGAIVFYCEKSENIATTPNSSYPRSELREHIEPGNFDINWTMEQGGRLSGRIQVTRSTPGDRFMVMQIHGRLTEAQRTLIDNKDNDAPPLLKIYYNEGKIEVAYKILKDRSFEGDNLLIKSNWTDAEHFYFSKSVGNEPFDLEIAAYSGTLEVSLNGVKKQFTDPDLAVWPFENYFKAGNYLTTRTDTAYSEVKFFHLNTEH